MANYDDMRRLMEQLLPIFHPSLFSNPDTAAAPESSAPIGHMTKGLFSILCDIFTVKQIVTLQRLKKFCLTSFSNALSSHEMYLRYVMFACDIEMRLSENVFDRILSIWALVINYIILTLEQTGVNFCEFAIDVFMVFYKRILKKQFFRQGGFKRLAEYLHEEYHCLMCHFNEDSKFSNVPAEKRKFFLINALRKSSKSVPYDLKNKSHDDILKDIGNQKLANEVFLIIKIKLPSLPSSSELKIRLHENKQKKAVRTDKRETPTASSKREAPEDEYKCETPANESIFKTPEDISKSETLAGIYKLKTSVDDSICKTSSDYSKRKTTTASLNLETLADCKRETPEDNSTFKTPRDDWIYKTPANDSQRLTPTGALKCKASATSFNRETQAEHYKRETPEDDSIFKTPADDWIYKTPANDSQRLTPTGALKYKTSSASLDCEALTDDCKHVTPADGSIFKTPADYWIDKTPVNNSQRLAPTGALKRKTSVAFLDRETQANGHKPEFSADDSEYKTPTDDSVYETPADETKFVTPPGVLKYQMAKILTNRSSNYKAIDSVEDKANIDWYNNIIRMVIIYNNTKLSNSDEVNNQILKEASNILEHLKDTITNLIKVLDEYDNDRNF